MVTFVPKFVNAACADWHRTMVGAAEAEGIAEADGTRFGAFADAYEIAHPQPPADLADVVAHCEHVREVAGIDHVGLGGDYDGVAVLPRGLEDVATYPALLEALGDRGWSEDDLAKLTCRNILRVMRDVESGARELQRRRGPSLARIEDLDGTAPPPSEVAVAWDVSRSTATRIGWLSCATNSLLAVTSTQTQPGEIQPDDTDKLDKNVLMIAGVVVLGAIMSILDITVVSVALETFQREFDATAAEVAWTMTGYTLALASVIPLTGWAADRFGTKRLYLLAVLLFTAGSVLCATATSLEMLVLYRVLQGLGGGMLMPLGMTILTRAAGPERVGRVMAVLGIPMLLGPIFGPIIGGALIDAVSWHWIFLINLPIGIAAIVYAWIVLPKDEVEPSETFDWVGMLLLSPGLAAVPLRRQLDPRARHRHRHRGAGRPHSSAWS